MNHSRDPLQGQHVLATTGPATCKCDREAQRKKARHNAAQKQDHLNTADDLVAQLKQEGKGTQAALSQGLVNVGTASHESGFLEHAPGSWQHQFVRSLPGASRKALFATSRCLAQRVMEASADVSLLLCGREELTAEQTEQRSRIITWLLNVRRGFRVQLWPAAWQPFPTALADRVTSLASQQGGSLVASCCQWGSFSNLLTISLANAADMTGLCEAAAAGQLQQVRILAISKPLGPPEVQQLLHTLGPQLEVLEVSNEPFEELTSYCEPLIMKVQGLTALRCLFLNGCWLTDGMMQQLCEHPTLCDVTLRHCRVWGDHTERHCIWERLSMQWACIDDLQRLPLAGVQQVHVLGRITCDPPPRRLSQSPRA